MATFPEKRKDEVSPCENDFGTFNPEFATELSNKLEHISPRNEEVSTIDMYDDRLHEMTASYSEISFDSLTSPPDASIFENRSFGGSPCSDEMACKKKSDSEGARFEPQDSDNKRPDKLELQRCAESSALQKKNVQSIHKTLQDLHLEGTVTTEGDMVLFVAEDLETKIKLSSPITKKGDTPPFPGSRISTPCLYRQALMPQLPSVDPNVLNDLEQEVRRLATSVDTLTENLAGILHSVSAITVECLETYRDAVCKTCDAVDSNIKLMYQLMAKCEELSKFMTRIYKLSEQLKAIKKLLDLFESAVST
ncbi:uncharacterized protein LOC126249660 [Schistocerca nitens]|uniref:uncharacterized protein LOC126249660 n=1 Tax=Schistocerca nitens TaxID=7011 RepID=UPI002118383C|nr:uncharacterized protein LOC126249660 [Schistocerca nitens]